MPRIRWTWTTFIASAHPPSDALERRRGEQREQEVPGDAVARRADEGQGGGRLVGEQKQRERTRTRAGARKRPAAASA